MCRGAEYVVLQRRRRSCVVVCIKLPKTASHNENQHHAAHQRHTARGAHYGQRGTDPMLHSVVARRFKLKYHFLEMRPVHFSAR